MKFSTAMLPTIPLAAIVFGVYQATSSPFGWLVVAIGLVAYYLANLGMYDQMQRTEERLKKLEAMRT